MKVLHEAAEAGKFKFYGKNKGNASSFNSRVRIKLRLFKHFGFLPFQFCCLTSVLCNVGFPITVNVSEIWNKGLKIRQFRLRAKI